jgi:hypothetical protein
MAVTAPPAPPGIPPALGTAPLEPKDGANEYAQHRAAQLMIPGEGIAQPVRQRQHPLADGQSAEHAIHQVRGQFGHAPAATRRAEPAALTGKRNQNLALAVGAAKARESLRQEAAR